MKFAKLLLASVFFGFFILSCATSYNKETCPKIDWNKKGLEDANNGNKPNRKALHGCSTHVDYEKAATSYTEGYTTGIEKFCTEPNGHYWGSLGRSYDDTCPVVLEKKFLTGFKTGKRQYEEAEEQRKKLKEEQEKLEEERKKLEEERRSQS